MLVHFVEIAPNFITKCMFDKQINGKDRENNKPIFFLLFLSQRTKIEITASFALFSFFITFSHLSISRSKIIYRFSCLWSAFFFGLTLMHSAGKKEEHCKWTGCARFFLFTLPSLETDCQCFGFFTHSNLALTLNVRSNGRVKDDLL